MFRIHNEKNANSYYSEVYLETEDINRKMVNTVNVTASNLNSILRPAYSEPKKIMSIQEYKALKVLLDDLGIPAQDIENRPVFPVQDSRLKHITFDQQTLLTEEIRDLKEKIINVTANMVDTANKITNTAKSLNISTDQINRIVSATEGILATVADFQDDIFQDGAPQLRRGPLTSKRNQPTAKNIHQ